MRTPEERDRQTLTVVTYLVRFLCVVAWAWVALAALDLAVGVDRGEKVPLLVASVGLGILAVVPLVRARRRDPVSSPRDRGGDASRTPGRSGRPGPA